METFKTIHLKPKISGLYCSPVQPHIVHLDAGRVSGSLQICPEGGHNNQNYALQVSTIKIGTSIQLGSFGPIGLKFGPTIDPILVHLTQIFTGVSSNNLMYALVVVSILKNVQ